MPATVLFSLLCQCLLLTLLKPCYMLCGISILLIRIVFIFQRRKSEDDPIPKYEDVMELSAAITFQLCRNRHCGLLKRVGRTRSSRFTGSDPRRSQKSEMWYFLFCPFKSTAPLRHMWVSVLLPRFQPCLFAWTWSPMLGLSSRELSCPVHSGRGYLPGGLWQLSAAVHLYHHSLFCAIIFTFCF